MKVLDTAATDFVQRTADSLCSERMPRIAAEIFALLIVAGEPLGAEEMAVLLKASRAAVGTNIRLLEAAGIVARTVRPGERCALYALSDDPFGNVVDAISKRFGSLARVAADALANGLGDANPELGRMRLFFETLHANGQTFLTQWRSR